MADPEVSNRSGLEHPWRGPIMTFIINMFLAVPFAAIATVADEGLLIWLAMVGAMGVGNVYAISYYRTEWLIRQTIEAVKANNAKQEATLRRHGIPLQHDEGVTDG